MTDLDSKFSMANLSELYKTVYGKRSINLYNNSDVTYAGLRKFYNFTGAEKKLLAQTSFQGGRGAGTLPEFSNASYVNPLLTRKKVYGRARFDRESIKAAQSSEGAFFNKTAEVVSNTVDTFNDWSRIILHMKGAGLGTITGTVTGSGTSGSPYVCTISNATWIRAFWSKNDLVNVASSTDKFRISNVDVTNKKISLVIQTGGSAVPAASDNIYMQGSKDAVPMGMGEVMSTTSGSLYGVTVDDTYKVTQLDAGAVALTVDHLVQAVLDPMERVGKTPNKIQLPFNQYRRIINQLEDKKVIQITPRDTKMTTKLSFRAIALDTPAGEIPLIPNRYLHEDEVWVTNDDMIEVHHAPDFGWFDDDGTVFMRMTDDDAYEARYGGYYEIYVNSPFHVRIHNLAS